MSEQPLFSIGEEVILQSEYLPEYNGEYVVKKIECGFFVDAFTRRVDDCVVYDLGFRPNEGSAWWDQCALRKKHKPSSKSFDELMKDLNKIGVN